MTPNEVSDLINSLSAAFWPIGTFAAVLIFRSEIKHLIARISKVKLGENEIEINKEIDEFQKITEKAKDDVPLLENSNNDANSTHSEFDEIIHDAQNNPKLAVMTLAIRIEKYLRELMACGGHHKPGTNFNVMGNGLKYLQMNKSVPENMIQSLRIFWDLRNKVVHGVNCDENDILRIIDIGITAYKSLHSIPRGINIVHKTDVAVYNDPNCLNVRNDVKGIILKNTSPGGTQVRYHIFPTTKSWHKIGSQVTWEWDMTNKWGQTWYKNQNGEILNAWGSSAEFIGRDVESLQ